MKDISDESIEVGNEAYVIEGIEGFIEEGKIYTITGLREEEGRVVVIDDRGLEGWYRATRFLATKNASHF